MEEYKRLITQIDESVYRELESFWVNNTNFTDAQSDKFITLIEKINNHSKEVKSKQYLKKNSGND
jgi:hypothetical protein